MKCPRDNTELELIDERMSWEKYRCPECKMKVTLTEEEEDEE